MRRTSPDGATVGNQCVLARGVLARGVLARGVLARGVLARADPDVEPGGVT